MSIEREISVNKQSATKAAVDKRKIIPNVIGWVATLMTNVQKWADSDQDYEYVEIERDGEDFMKRINSNPLMIGFIIESLLTAGHPSLLYSRKKKEKK